MMEQKYYLNFLIIIQNFEIVFSIDKRRFKEIIIHISKLIFMDKTV